MQKNSNCLVCGNSTRELKESADYLICRFCGAVYNTSYQQESYSDTYFTSDYIKQYGKSYLDDYDFIYSKSLMRLSRINKLYSKKEFSALKSVLDVGAAYGFFLKACEDIGFKDMNGVEISKHASIRAKELYNFDFDNIPFSEFKPVKNYDLVTAWYFIEHEENPVSALKKLLSIVEPGGAIAFSVPSVYGPLFKKNIKKWVETHPKDHRMDFSPKSVKLILKNEGFRKVKVYASGIHPERYFTKKSILFPLKALFYKVICSFTAYSDTIDVVAVKDYSTEK